MFHRRALFSSTNEQGHTHCTECYSVGYQMSDSCILHINWQCRSSEKKDDYHNYAAGDSSNGNDHGGEDHDDDPPDELMLIS